MELDVRRVLDSLGEPLLTLDRSARILHANAALKELLGWSHRELLGRPLSMLIPAGLPPLPLQQQGPSSRHRFRVTALRHDGTPREVEVHLSPWPGGEAEGLHILSFRELDALLALERQLQLQHRLSLQEAAVGRALAQAVDEEEAAYRVLQSHGRAEGWVLATYWQVDPEARVLRPLTVWTESTALPEVVEATLGQTFTRGEDLPGLAWSRRAPVWSQDIAREPGCRRAELAVRQGLYGGLCIPVLGGQRLHGVLEFLSREGRGLSEEDEAVASALGYQVGRLLDRLHREQAESIRQAGLRRLWESDLLGLLISDTRGHLLDANPALLRMLGYSQEDVREGRLSWAALTPPQHRAASEEALRRLQAEGTYHSFESEYLRKNDSVLPVLVGSASLDGDRVASFVLDLSDWKPVESPPRHSADARLPTLIAHAPVVLFALDRDGVFTLSEGHGLHALGLKPEQVVGTSLFEFYRTEPALLAHARRALSGEEFLAVDQLANGLLWETRWTPLRDAEGHLDGCIGLAVDVTAREREAHWREQLFLQAQEARAAAEEAVRMRDEFLTLASHELKTPLTSLNLQIQILLRRARESALRGGAVASQMEHLVRVQRQIQRLVHLTNELLDISRVSSGRLPLDLKEVDLTRLVREVLERFHDEAARVGTSLTLHGDEAVVGRWDRTRLEQVVTNLLSNAVKYGAGAPVEVSVYSSGAMALLEVTDHGIGIEPGDVERIFGKFERAVPARKYGGFGLGLYLVRQWVEALGGAVDVESTPGAGATFHIVLPLAGPAAHPPTHAPGAGLH